MSKLFEGMELEVEKPSRMTIMDPRTGLPLVSKDGAEAWLDLYSADSTKSTKLRREMDTRLRSRTKLEPPADDEIERERVTFLAALTAGWHLVGLDGANMDVPFSDANARELYSSNGMIWLREQADFFIGTRANFAPASSNN